MSYNDSPPSESSFNFKSKEDFSKAYWKGFWNSIFSWLRRSNNELLPFDEVRKRIPMRGQHYRGLMQIETSRVIGSESRFNDFDRAFLPRQVHTRERWESIDRAYFQDVILPPIDVYKVGEVYFVKDGNHRVSVARERGQAFMDAYVVEIDIPGNLDEKTDINRLIKMQEYAQFLETTGLDKLYPGENFEFSVPGQYEKVLEHIKVHRYFMGMKKDRPIEDVEAVKGWYSEVYHPLIKIIRKKKILDEFPHRTEMDLYLWIIEHRYFLMQEHNRPVSMEAAAENFTQEFSNQPIFALRKAWNRLTAQFKRTSKEQK
jgi:hypothetical protein